MESRRNLEDGESQGCSSRPKVDWPCEIPSQIPRQPFADMLTNQTPNPQRDGVELDS